MYHSISQKRRCDRCWFGTGRTRAIVMKTGMDRLEIYFGGRVDHTQL